jgi:DNA-directed RNA polymerase subunit M/transcription elongation factor TFIIS
MAWTHSKQFWKIDKQMIKTHDRITDLTGFTSIDPDDQVLYCFECSIALLPYEDIDGKHLTRGKLFYCGRCGNITDTEAGQLKYGETFTSEATKAQNAEVMFETIPTLPEPEKHEQFNIEADEEEALKEHGAKILKTRITVGGRVVRDDRLNDSNT